MTARHKTVMSVICLVFLIFGSPSANTTEWNNVINKMCKYYNFGSCGDNSRDRHVFNGPGFSTVKNVWYGANAISDRRFSH